MAALIFPNSYRPLMDVKQTETAIKQIKVSSSSPFPQSCGCGKVTAPLSIGGGIGQSRLCMFFLRKAPIGEIQVSLWSPETFRLCRENGILLP